MKLLFVLSALVLVAMQEPASVVAHRTKECTRGYRVCADGSHVYRNIRNDCEFDLCPEEIVDEDIEYIIEDLDDEGEDLDDDSGSDEDDDDDIPQTIIVKTIKKAKLNATTAPPTVNNTGTIVVPAKTEVPTSALPATKHLHGKTHPPIHTKHEKDERHKHRTTAPVNSEQLVVVTTPPVTASPATASPTTTSAPVVAKAADMFDANSTANGSVVEWIEINKIEIPRPVGQAVHDAFAGYESKQVCSTFIMTYDAIEIHANMNNTPYHIVVDVHCILNDIEQISGKFGLYLESNHRNGDYSVTQCSFEDASGTLINYLTISEAHKGACQTPPQKIRFDNQPLQYVKASTKESTTTFSSIDNAFHSIVHDNMWLAVAAAGTGVVVVGLLVGLVVITRRRRRRDSNPRRLGMEGSSAPSAVDDENGRLNQENDPSSTTSTISHVEGSFDVTTQAKV